MQNSHEVEALAKALAPVVKSAIERYVSQLRSEMESALAGMAEKLKEIVPPTQPSIDEIASAAAALVPAGKDGADGAPGIAGKDADPEVIRQMVADAIAQLPAPQDGADGKDGKDGVDGRSPSVEEVAAVFERRFSDLQLHWERQARETFEKAVDRMPLPKDGKDGRDAVCLDGFDIELAEDGRTVVVRMQAGEAKIEKSVKIASVLDRGVFAKEAAYERGDGVSYGGCLWIAQKDAPEGVPGGSNDWRLAVKKGRDGKDLRDNASLLDPSKGVSIK